jgi:hypothetical protein
MGVRTVTLLFITSILSISRHLKIMHEVLLDRQIEAGRKGGGKYGWEENIAKRNQMKEHQPPLPYSFPSPQPPTARAKDDKLLTDFEPYHLLVWFSFPHKVSVTCYICVFSGEVLGNRDTSLKISSLKQ